MLNLLLNFISIQKKSYFFFWIFLFFSCNNAIIDLQNFDIQTWKDDKLGCEGKRAALLEEFNKKIKPQLKGLREKQIQELFGRADAQELSKRNQKFYFYYLDAGKQCKNRNNQADASKLQIRFDALNRVNEVVTIIQ